MPGGQQVLMLRLICWMSLIRKQLAEEVARGSQFAPMIVHWKNADTSMPSRPYVSFSQLYPTTTTINTTVTPGHIVIIYPNTKQPGSDTFEYLIGDLPATFWASGENVSTLSLSPRHPAECDIRVDGRAQQSAVS